MFVKRALAVTAVALAAVATSSQPALASSRIQVAGLGTSVANTSGGYDYSGYLNGQPFSGNFTGAMAAADGTLPAVGQCEPGTATLRVEDTRGRYYQLVGTGEVCELFLPLGVMQRFTGRWTVESTNVHRLVKTDGFLDVRLLNGQSDVYAIDS